MYCSLDNIWSVLFTTGYPGQRGGRKGKGFTLAIPNLEVRDIFVSQIMEYFKESVKKDGGIEKILKYGIACYKKRCRVVLAEL